MPSNTNTSGIEEILLGNAVSKDAREFWLTQLLEQGHMASKFYSPGVLVIVDMQKVYDIEPPGYLSVVMSILKEIEKAKKNAWQIVVVEYNPEWMGSVPTRPDIMEEIGSEFIKVKKTTEDGSPRVIQALKRKKIIPAEIAVCGMITQCCVLHMVKGLRREYGKEIVKVVKDAVFGNGPWEECLIDDVALQYHDPRRTP